MALTKKGSEEMVQSRKHFMPAEYKKKQYHEMQLKQWCTAHT
jgi:hypothetical protein